MALTQIERTVLDYLAEFPGCTARFQELCKAVLETQRRMDQGHDPMTCMTCEKLYYLCDC